MTALTNQKLFNDHKFNWDKIQSHIHKLTSTQERIIYLKWLLNEHKILAAKPLPLFHKHKDNFIRVKEKIERELNRQNSLLELIDTPVKEDIMLSVEPQKEIISTKENIKEHLTVEEAAEYLNVSTSTIYKYTHQNTLAYSKPTGKKVYFKKEDIDKFLKNKRSKSNEEIEQNAREYYVKKWKK